ncbi:BUD13 homolog [Drosophila grimshawi]|uniref:BUD13 homolog n=1 Tax=Drosophila grimshawi TaxID=7222 RepID=B4JFV9_DROGR|nr:BUD13 homolog [Drosophila grimshawi]EDV93590.1 GH19401 [Drosophila grimshawi]
MSMQNAKLINQKEYLKKYLSGDKEKKKKKEKKQKKKADAKVKIIDDDACDANTEEMDEDLLLGGEDAPQIVGEYIEENANAMRCKWRNIAVKDEPKTEQNEANDGRIKEEPRDDEQADLWGVKVKQERGARNSPLAIRIKQEKRSSSREPTPWEQQQSPRRRKRRDSDVSPMRKRRNSDQSPPRRQRDQSLPRRHKSPSIKRRDSDQSPPRRHPNADQSPPRRRKHSDQSPPRRRPAANQTPPRRRADSDQSPARRRRDSDQSPPRRPQTSPRNRRNSDQSPPRWRVQSPGRKRSAADQSPSRRHKSPSIKRRDADQSPPRRRPITSTDQSPPRRRRDSPPPRMTRKEEKRTLSSPPAQRERKSRWARTTPSRTPSPPPTHKPKTQSMRTLDGKKAGLQDAKSLKTESDSRRRDELRMFEQMSSEVSGRHAEVQMRSTGRRGRRAREAAEEDPAEQQRKAAHEEKKKELYERWGKGLKQLEDQRTRHAEMAHEAAKPVARYANDEDLDRHLREQEHADDPMLEYMRQKRKKREQQSDNPVLPVYEGSYPENRYAIRPGYRWDGVDRSNGYEQRWFDKQNERRAVQDEAYKYSVEDM